LNKIVIPLLLAIFFVMSVSELSVIFGQSNDTSVGKLMVDNLIEKAERFNQTDYSCGWNEDGEYCSTPDGVIQCDINMEECLRIERYLMVKKEKQIE